MNIKDTAFNYDKFGHKYSGHRQTDPRIAEYVYRELAEFKTILNVGAGSGSYEPDDKYVTAVESSVVMRAQRMANGKVPAINAKADHLPFDDHAFDVSMAMVTIYH
ncbi:ubiquinone/menaquinone biosynthesis C-methylase UbiE [Chryseobacterium defluvii]|uniref:Ubiquinone/menaquinone biosynthesis C-methylase UbiE n=1 Tax=Chryseobacterium defluvii TaxID=160396 RepID=A0A840KC25_9FLAO|nr:class I SAM-dependent methyltransferase [Chryseobacterium defluvii]MBB4806746.1 ubiquinone/menaquinone biosynthesis C-methylase UbiE [Chryseobacterium defluvii]